MAYEANFSQNPAPFSNGSIILNQGQGFVIPLAWLTVYTLFSVELEEIIWVDLGLQSELRIACDLMLACTKVL